MKAQEARPAGVTYAQAPSSVNDVWRKTMGINLRSEAAKFILTAFNLDVFSDQPPGSAVSLTAVAMERWFAERFSRFLSTEPEAHYAMDHGRFISLRVPKPVTDVALCEYASGGELKRITPFFDARQPLDADSPEAAEAARIFIAAFNQTRHLPEVKRTRALSRLVAEAPSEPARRIGARLLAATAVSFQSGIVKQEDRFSPPDFRSHRGFGIGYMAALCRRSPDGRGIDLWLQCHHAGADGGPIQEMLDRLESSWGVTAPILLPPDDPSRKQVPSLCHCDEERETALLTDFIDFSPIQQLRRELAASLVPAKAESVPLVGLFMWCLSHQPAFAGAGINTAVDLPPSGNQPRAVDLVSVVPSRYHGKPGGFTDYLNALNRLFAEARVRKTESWKTLVKLHSMPPILGAAMLRFNENGTRKMFGTLTVSLVKGTHMVIAPMPDSAWDHGFIAVGTVGAPAENGTVVTPVSIKGQPGRIGEYPAAIRRAISECRSYVK